jgi:DNA-directed RNA polymerase specialized sigma subunit
MRLDLTEAESAVLEDVLSEHLAEVKEQIYKAEMAEFKERLKERERLVLGLLERVRSGRASPTLI